MTITRHDFNKIAKGKREAPFSVRLTFEERAKLEAAANGVPLAAYIKARLFDGDLPQVRRRNTNPVEDHLALGRVLAALGRSKRTKQDPKAIMETMQQCWAGSDSGQAFETALRERGYFLARGDQRGYVAVDWRGEIYSLSRTTGAKAKDLQARLGDALDLQSVEQAKAFVSERMTPKLKAWAKEAEALAEKQNLAAQFQREQMVQRHRHGPHLLMSHRSCSWFMIQRTFYFIMIHRTY
ncbi:hypothetical protein [Tabrizicola sp.]|uniref:hypothetical protein n=1 Tax=Tabrizicola sp. TaxID=2005166 RepID=UPI00261A2BAD|nr:hypothetical protein [Tabrizicola sp.]MDM7932999.1 hypothetical protein [Tabrizicola sp.]